MNGIPTGNSQVGYIDANGLYSAPSFVPAPATVTVQAAITAPRDPRHRKRDDSEPGTGAGNFIRHAEPGNDWQLHPDGKRQFLSERSRSEMERLGSYNDIYI